MIVNRKFNIWQVSREMAPFAEAGGIKDVVAGLSRALVDGGHKVTVVIPLYNFLMHYHEAEPILEFSLDFGHFCQTVKVFRVYYHHIRILLISAPCFNTKEQVYTYSFNEESINSEFEYGSGHHDCHFMNLVLQRSSLESALRLDEQPDFFHLHDGHCGFLPAIMRLNNHYRDHFSQTSTLLTIHNGGVVYQQNIGDLEEVKNLTGLNESVLEDFQLESGYSPILCSGIYGYISTVSEQYADEIMSGSDKNSGILGQILKEKRIELKGITNGIEVDRYKDSPYIHMANPDPLSSDLSWKSEHKNALFEKIAYWSELKCVYGSLIENPHIPLFTMQSRITFQKGVDIFLDCMERVFDSKKNINVLVVGEGEKKYEEKLVKLAEGRRNFCYIRKYDTTLSHHLFTSGDFFLIPSRWEPCGLTDFIAQLYGNIPIVHETGGLKKTVNMKNGLSYRVNSGESLFNKVSEACRMYDSNSHKLFKIRKNAVNRIYEKYTWEKVLAKGYFPLYRKISKKQS